MTALQPMFPIQEAVYSVLSDDPELMDEVTGVFDYVPEDQSYPYVVVGEAQDTPNNAHGRFGRETVITLHIWSDYKGNKEAARIARRVVELLDHEKFDLEDHHHIGTLYELGESMRDSDPSVRHHVSRFRVITEQA